MKKLKVAIIGSKNIATDLLIKVLRPPHLDIGVFIERTFSSQGMSKSRSLFIPVFAEGTKYFIDDPGAVN